MNFVFELLSIFAITLVYGFILWCLLVGVTTVLSRLIARIKEKFTHGKKE